MPPTPFHPTHTTPFKSSLSSSQQLRDRHGGGSGSGNSSVDGPADAHMYGQHPWPPPLPAAQLDVRHWTYLAEGGKNLLLRYIGPDSAPFVTPDGRKMALRMTKVLRAATSSSSSSSSGGGAGVISEEMIASSSDGDDEHIDPLIWRDEIIERSLTSAVPAHAIKDSQGPGQSNFDEASPARVPPLLPITDVGNGHELARFLRALATKIEVMRPLERRRASGIDEYGTQGIYVTEDLGAPSPTGTSIVFEIKPKCGFLPVPESLSPETAPAKTNYSRYRMHRVLKSKGKLSPPEFDDLYDPLDLYSGDAGRIGRAAAALQRDWTSASPHTNNLRVFLDGKQVEGSTAGREKVDAAARLLWPSASGLSEALPRLLANDKIKSVLAQLLYLQRLYDAIDVESIEQRFRKARGGKGLAEAADEPPISIDEYRSVVAGSGITLDSADSTASVRADLARLLLSATFKDCSLFIHCSMPTGRDDNSALIPAAATTAAAAAAAADPERDQPSAQPVLQVYLVDLDPKPVSKLPYLLAVDQNVVRYFKTWADKNGVPLPSGALAGYR